MIKVLLVDDHQLVRAGLKYIVADVHGMRVVGEAETGKEAVNITRELHPDVTVMDGNLAGIGSLETTRRMLHIDPDCKIIILAEHHDEAIASSFMRAGAVGYLMRACSVDEFVNTIRKAHVGQRYIAADIAQKLALKRPGDRTPVESLTERELQILGMITHGDTVQHISDVLCLSTKTVNSHRYRIFSKLNLNNDVELTHFAYRHGLLADLDLSSRAVTAQHDED